MIKSLPSPDAGARIVYDADLPGFGIRLTSSGARSFVFNYVIGRRERRMTIGRHPAWSTSAAREQARAMKRDVNLGIDPLAEMRSATDAAEAERLAPTVRELFERYDREHLPSKAPRSAADDRAMWRDYILPALGQRRVTDVAFDEVDRLHASIGREKPVRANRVIEVLRKAFNLAIRWGWRADNPATGVRRNREEGRDRYLTPAEILRLGEALRAHPERMSANAITLLMLTGARRSEVLRASWDQFDLEAGIWRKPSAHTKQRKVHRVPLSAPAIALLRSMRSDAQGAFLFHGANPEKPLTDVKRTWLAVCKAAGLAEETPVRTTDGAPVLEADGTPNNDLEGDRQAARSAAHLCQHPRLAGPVAAGDRCAARPHPAADNGALCASSRRSAPGGDRGCRGGDLGVKIGDMEVTRCCSKATHQSRFFHTSFMTARYSRGRAHAAPQQIVSSLDRLWCPIETILSLAPSQGPCRLETARNGDPCMHASSDTQRLGSISSPSRPGNDQQLITIQSKTYLNADQLARLLGVTPRTLARWDEARIGPPRIKVGKMVLFDCDKLPAWLESHERAGARHDQPRRSRIRSTGTPRRSA